MKSGNEYYFENIRCIDILFNKIVQFKKSRSFMSARKEKQCLLSVCCENKTMVLNENIYYKRCKF